MITVRRLEIGEEDALDSFLAQYPLTSMYLRGNLRQAGLRYEGRRPEGR